MHDHAVQDSQPVAQLAAYRLLHHPECRSNPVRSCHPSEPGAAALVILF